jgi:hypothetical protein
MKLRLASLTLSAVLAAGSLVALPVQDQPPQAPAHRPADPNRQLKMLSNKLALTADQQSKILPILTDRQQQIASIQGDSTLSKKVAHAKMKAVRSDSESKLRAVLTDTQREAYDQMQADNRERERNRKQISVNPI